MEKINKEIDTRWVLLEDGYPHTVLLTKDEAEYMIEHYQNKYPNLSYALFYDEYYEFTEIINEN